MGPHQPGRDEILDCVRYVLVAVYTFPETLGVDGKATPDDPEHGPPLDLEEQDWEVPEVPDPVEPGVEEPQPDLSEELELPRVPMVELVWVEPLARKTEADTLRATKRVHAALSLLGLPIARVHTDGGREFCNKGFRAWCDDNSVVKSCTGADDFRSNGRAENIIGVLKGGLERCLGLEVMTGRIGRLPYAIVLLSIACSVSIVWVGKQTALSPSTLWFMCKRDLGDLGNGGDVLCQQRS